MEVKSRTNVYKFLAKDQNGRHHLGELGADGRPVLRWIIWKYVVGAWIGLNWRMIG
jgi:hypothetical protein